MCIRIDLITQCRYYTSNGYTFDKFVDIRTIRKASTEGYVLRTVFYVQGGPKAYILLSASDNEDDLAYEIEIGALTVRTQNCFVELLSSGKHFISFLGCLFVIFYII